MTIVPFPPQAKVDYPESDGKPMAETLQHILVIIYLLNALMYWFRDRMDMYVGANNLIYYEEGFPNISFAPDVYLIPGLDKTPRRVLKLWQEKRAPAVIFEITSRGTWEQDLGDKLDLYERLGVREYFVYDVEHAELDPVLRGFRLVDETYEAIRPNPAGGLYSEEIKLAVQEMEGTLRLVNPVTNAVLKNYSENQAQVELEQERTQVERERAEMERERARAAEEENARLRAEIEKLRGKQG